MEHKYIIPLMPKRMLKKKLAYFALIVPRSPSDNEGAPVH